jgi:hypothetical protein
MESRTSAKGAADAELSGRRRAQHDGNPTAPPLGAPLERRVGRQSHARLLFLEHLSLGRGVAAKVTELCRRDEGNRYLSATFSR